MNWWSTSFRVELFLPADIPYWLYCQPNGQPLSGHLTVQVWLRMADRPRLLDKPISPVSVRACDLSSHFGCLHPSSASCYLVERLWCIVRSSHSGIKVPTTNRSTSPPGLNAFNRCMFVYLCIASVKLIDSADSFSCVCSVRLSRTKKVTFSACWKCSVAITQGFHSASVFSSHMIDFFGPRRNGWACVTRSCRHST